MISNPFVRTWQESPVLNFDLRPPCNQMLFLYDWKWVWAIAPLLPLPWRYAAVAMAIHYFCHGDTLMLLWWYTAWSVLRFTAHAQKCMITWLLVAGVADSTSGIVSRFCLIEELPRSLGRSSKKCRIVLTFCLAVPKWVILWAGQESTRAELISFVFSWVVFIKKERVTKNGRDREREWKRERDCEVCQQFLLCGEEAIDVIGHLCNSKGGT